MSDETTARDVSTTTGNEAPGGSERPTNPEGTSKQTTGSAGERTADGEPRKRRRRGSRGGRNRRKKTTGDGPGSDRDDADDDRTEGPRKASGRTDDRPQAERSQGKSSQAGRGQADRGRSGRQQSGDDRSDSGRQGSSRRSRSGGGDDRSREARGDDYTDERADRGLTSDDVADDAKVDAGLRKPRIGDTRPAPRPKVGDTIPAAASDAAAEGNGRDGGNGGGGSQTPKRRRRRGGRGRGRSKSKPGNVVTQDVADRSGVDLDDLDEETLERRRGRTRKGRPAGRYTMCVHRRDNGEVHIAVLEGRSLVEHYVSSPDAGDTSIDGNIYLGKVQNVLPGMEAAFIDFGTPKNGVLYRGDVAFDPADVEGNRPRIETLLKNGQTITVQVTKNPIGAKGARLTQEVSLAGRFVVLVPGEPQTYGISKRLPDDERKRLRNVLDKVRPDDAGLIVRTAAEGATTEELTLDVQRLTQQWNEISKLAQGSKPPRLLYQEPNMVVRIIREEFTKEYRAVIIDDRELYEEVHAYVDAIAPELAERIEHYDAEDEGLHVFERFHVHEQLHKALDRKVWLPSGGSLIIERTEALTVIDVNTGKNVGKSNLEETVFRNNLEAADEVARQLRLRDIGGIIVIDFIDMEIKKNRDEVNRSFKEALARDKTRTQVFEISELGLVEMTRKRISEGLVESFSETCPTCEGRGILLDQSFLDEMN